MTIEILSRPPSYGEVAECVPVHRDEPFVILSATEFGANLHWQWTKEELEEGFWTICSSSKDNPCSKQHIEAGVARIRYADGLSVRILLRQALAREIPQRGTGEELYVCRDFGLKTHYDLLT